MVNRYKTISSLSNPLIKEAIKIKKRKCNQDNSFIIEGLNLMEAVFFSPLAIVRRLFFSENFIAKKGFKRISKHIKGIDKILVTEKIISAITDTDSPQGIAAIVSYNPPKLSELKPDNKSLFILCDAIQDPGNLGTIIRASDAFGANAVIILPFTCDPFNAKAIRATAGSIFNIPVIYANRDEILEFFRIWNIKFFSTSRKAKTSIYEVNLRQQIAIAFGNESAGVNEALQKEAIDILRIPILGKAESLNVAMAASICLYEIARQRNF